MASIEQKANVLGTKEHITNQPNKMYEQKISGYTPRQTGADSSRGSRQATSYNLCGVLLWTTFSCS